MCAGTVNGEHAYGAAGVYPVTLTLSDGQASASATFHSVVFYDPSGGWFDSPAGAYRPDSGLSGKATFGFVSRYHKGATALSGITQFQFAVAGLNFQSSSYEWLVVNQSGTNARFKGSGTVNGSGSYKFMLWAADGSPDTFRIKIWEELAGVETVIYDNGDALAIGGGAIVVQTK